MTAGQTSGDTCSRRYVALGDSYTIGTSVEPADRWPEQLVAALGGDPPALELVANLGINGYTSADVIRSAGNTTASSRTTRSWPGSRRSGGIRFVDIFDLSLGAAADRSFVANDGLHPNGTQYARWVERIAPVVSELLSA